MFVSLTLDVEEVSMHAMDAAQEREFYLGLGVAVRRRRDGLAMTQATLGERIGLTRSSVANLEAGRQRVPLHVLHVLADALEVAPQELLPPRQPSVGARPRFDLGRVEREVSAESPHAAEFVRSVMQSLAQRLATEPTRDQDAQDEAAVVAGVSMDVSSSSQGARRGGSRTSVSTVRAAKAPPARRRAGHPA